MRVILLPRAAKSLKNANEPTRSRIVKGLQKLGEEPSAGDIAKLEGRDGYRLRIGGYRVLFKPEDGKIIVTDIEPRGGVYKGA